MINESDLEAWDYYDPRDFDKSSSLNQYSEFVESMILTFGRDRLAENTLGLVGEAGEVSEKIKKFFRDGTIDNVAIQKELGDVIFYWVALHNALNLKPYDTIMGNMNKLKTRKRNGTIRGSGDDR